MSDALLLGLAVLGLAGMAAGVYFYLMPKGNDVRKIDPASQERPKNSSSSSAQSKTSSVAKTAQLSALRERLADAQTTNTGLKKMPTKAPEKPAEKSWRPEEAGLGDVPAVAPLSSRSAELTRAVSPSPLIEKPSVPAAPVAAKPLVFEEAPLPAVPVASPAIPVATAPEPMVAAEAPVRVSDFSDVPKPAAVAPVQDKQDKVHILLVDDSKVVRVKTEKLLLNKGYAVTTAVDGIDALAKLETLKPAIIITDIEMPNLDGFGLVRNVRGNLRTADIPVIVMTSHVNLHLDIAATEGINGFLPKPFNDQDLLDQVAFLCEG